MGDANEYSTKNKELNYISRGFLWGLWNLLPIAGSIILKIKILNRVFKSTSSKVLMFIALIIPLVNIGGAIVFLVFVFKRIGGRFLIGVLIVPFLFGILAAISIPQYGAYIKAARVTMATSIMRAIITSQKVERSRTGDFYSIPPVGRATDIAAFGAKGIDITDTRYFTYETVATGTKPDDGFTVTATTTDDFGAARGWMTFTYDPTATRTASWTCDGWIIRPARLPTQGGDFETN